LDYKAYDFFTDKGSNYISFHHQASYKYNWDDEVWELKPTTNREASSRLLEVE